MEDIGLTCSPEEIAAREVDVLIIGSGPAGVAVAERVLHTQPDWTVGILERGPIITLTHINNIFPNKLRRPFINRFGIRPWEGTFQDNGMLMPALGGRSIVAGAMLRRFDPADYTCWPKGIWPNDVIRDIQRYYEDAEANRRVNPSSIVGPAQTWALATLSEFQAKAPVVGFDGWSGGGFEVPAGYDSAVARLWRLLIQDALRPENRRLFVAVNTLATRIESEGTAVECVDLSSGSKGRIRIPAKSVVVAASPIESARLLLLSTMDLPTPVGCYLAEHIERRAKIEITRPMASAIGQGISVLVPPKSNKQEDRFQIHLRGQYTGDGRIEIEIGGFAAMDPASENRVTLSSASDEYGISRAHIHLATSAADDHRADRMCRRMLTIASKLGGNFITSTFPYEGSTQEFTSSDMAIQRMPPGRSYHEAGTLRMGTNRDEAVTDPWGTVYGTKNLYIADAALFPSVGVANPMLTITALAYRVADRIASS